MCENKCVVRLENKVLTFKTYYTRTVNTTIPTCLTTAQFCKMTGIVQYIYKRINKTKRYSRTQL